MTSEQVGRPAEPTPAPADLDAAASTSAPDDLDAAESTADAQPNRASVLDQIGGPMAMLDSALPVVVFVAVNVIGGLRWAIIAAIATGVAIAVARLARHRPVSQAIGGLFGVAIAAVIAYRTGSAKGYFAFGIWTSLAYGAVFLASVLVRFPLAGVLWEGLNGRSATWRRDRKLVRRYDLATLVWVVVFGLRFVVQHWLYDTDRVGWLAAARVAMGYPLFIVAIVLTVIIVGRANGVTLSAVWAAARGRRGTAESRPQA